MNQALLRTSWTHVADGYLQHFVPRFLPWISYTAETFISLQTASPSTQPQRLLIAGTGPGAELLLLAKQLPPNYSYTGIDLAPGMVQLAKQAVATAGLENIAIDLREGDASTVPADIIPVNGILSCFTLQQMPSPPQVLANWTQALAPNGILTVTFWPTKNEEVGPWQQLRDVTPAPKSSRDNWEECLVPAIEAEGGEVLKDELVLFEMRWPSASAFFDLMVDAGPWNSRKLKYGDEHIAEIKNEFMTAYPDDGSSSEGLVHKPSARMIVVQKQRDAPAKL